MVAEIQLFALLSMLGFQLDELGQGAKGLFTLCCQAKRLLPKLLSKDEGRSSIKYMLSVLLLDFEYLIEKMFGLLARVWISILSVLVEIMTLSTGDLHQTW